MVCALLVATLFFSTASDLACLSAASTSPAGMASYHFLKNFFV